MKDTLFGSLLSLYEKRSQDGHRTPLEDFCTESLVGLLRLYKLEKKFIQEVLKCNISNEDIDIKTQYARDDCRVDIVIKVEYEAVYFIEMKINAREGYEQLKRYDKLLSEKNSYEQKILFYCTKYLDKKKYKLENEFHQFRWNDIYAFLKKHEESKEAIKDFLRFLEKKNVAFEEKKFTKEYINMEKWNFNQLNNSIILCLDMLGINDRDCCDWIDKEIGGYKKIGEKWQKCEYKNIPIELGFNISEDKLFAYYWLNLKKYSEVTKIKAYHPISIRQDISPSELAQEWADDIERKVAQIQDEITNQFNNWKEQLRPYGNVCCEIGKFPFVGFESACNNQEIKVIIEFAPPKWGGDYYYGIHIRDKKDNIVMGKIASVLKEMPVKLRDEDNEHWYIRINTMPDKALEGLLALCKKMNESGEFKRIEIEK